VVVPVGTAVPVAAASASNTSQAAIEKTFMAKPNYQFEKRQRDLAKKTKQEEKRRQKLASKAAADEGGRDGTASTPVPVSSDVGGTVDTTADRGTPPER
jgi:hypothetical protein